MMADWDDKQTGLPEAPTGRYWRVSFDSNGSHAYIYLMHEGTRMDYPASQLDQCDWAGIYGGFWCSVFRGELLPKHKVRPRHIRSAAREVLRKREKAAAASLVAGVYAGDYPPKKLG